MAKANDDTTELDEFAFRLYAERVAKMPAQINGETSSIWAYKKAEEFLAVRARIKAGEELTKVPDGPQLNDASAPRLKPTHPHNLVSKRFGDLTRVRKIHEWLQKHPPRIKPDQAPIVFSELEWDEQTTNLAREIFPHYCMN